MTRSPDLTLTGLALVGLCLAAVGLGRCAGRTVRRGRLSDDELRRMHPAIAERMGRGAPW